MPENFKNIVAVFPWLEAQGYKVTLKTLYNHEKKGWIKPDEDGSYALNQVKKYAEKRLKFKSAVLSRKREEKVSEKENEDLRLTKVRADAEEFKLAKERGQYIAQADVDLQFTAKAIALYSEIMGAFEAGIMDVVEIAGGEEKNAGLVLGYLKDILDGAMNEYASGKVYEIEADKAENVEH